MKCSGLSFSLSGVENKVMQYRASGASAEETARYALLSVISAVTAATEALKQYPGLAVVFSGGVSGNSLLRERCREFDAAFAEPRFSLGQRLRHRASHMVSITETYLSNNNPE